MDLPHESQSSPRRVKRQRPSYSCTECSRRKLRCSKRVPCLACIERGTADKCQRRPTAAQKQSKQTAKSRRTTDKAYASLEPPEVMDGFSGRDMNHSSHNTSAPNMPVVALEKSTSVTWRPENWKERPRLTDTVTQDAAVMLEFLALSRRQVLRSVQMEQSPISQTLPKTINLVDSLFTWTQINRMMTYHEECIAWIHNVVHMPTFRKQCERLFEGDDGSIEEAWVSLYYAMIAVTIYHTDSSKLAEFGIQSGYDLSIQYYQKSLNNLDDVDFMKNHSLFNLQAICLLIYIGHNLGQSDRMSVLLASGTRIAQCLGLHRLGPDGSCCSRQEMDQKILTQRLIDREISKRIWWFFVRQDWLQIPFNNTYNIHLTQFNTPMPANCDEDISAMVNSSQVVNQHKDHLTQGSYTSVLNQVAIIIWKMQDRICLHFNENGGEDGLRELYPEILRADQELKDLINKMPIFFKPNYDMTESPKGLNTQQSAVLMLSHAHKFYSIHRHFQIPSFKEPWFAYTKISCLPAMRRYLRMFLDLPQDQYTTIVKSLWTVNTQVLTAAVWLLFELILSKDECQGLLDAEEIRDLALRSLQFLHENQAKSSIAKRGSRLIECLLEMDGLSRMGTANRFSLKEIISRVELSDSHMDQQPAEMSSEARFSDMMDFVSLDAIQWDSVLNTFCEI